MKGKLEVIAKRCYSCETVKPLSEFYKNNAKADGLSSECKECNKVRCSTWYAENKEQQLLRNALKTQKNRERWLEYLLTHPCLDCGESDPVVLEADHLGNKRYNISHLVQNYSWNAVLTELEKCEIVCANCHRKRTAKSQGWFKHEG